MMAGLAHRFEFTPSVPSGTLVVLILALVLSGCDCNQKEGLTTRDKAQIRQKSSLKRIVPSAPIYAPSKELRQKMKRIHLLTKDIRRRLSAKIKIEHPAKVLSLAITQVPRAKSSKEFGKQLAILQQRAEQLGHSKQPAKSFDRLVDQCLHCHQTQAKSWVPQLLSLRVLAAAKPTPPAVGR